MKPLALLSSAWSAAASARAALYSRGLLRRQRLRRPTISVGALEMGGSGKSPAVTAIAALLRENGIHPAILSRGYRREGSAPVLVSAGDGLRCSTREAGDEPALYARGLPGVPVAVAARREEAADLIPAAAGVDVFLLDDAFQHLRVARDLDLLMVNAERPFWRSLPPPAGRLREAPRAASRADAFLLTGDRGDRCREELARRFPGKPIHELDEASDGALPWNTTDEAPGLPPEPTLPFAGIARPRRLDHALRAAGLSPLPLVTFADHHWYTDRDLERLARTAREQGAASLVTTPKDAVRITRAVPGLPLWVWQYRLVPTDPAALLATLRGAIAERS